MNNAIEITLGNSGSIDFNIQEQDNISFASQNNDDINVGIQESENVSMEVNTASRNINFEMGNQIVGTNDYKKLLNKPSINSVILIENKTSEDLGLQPAGSYANTKISNIEIDELFR